MSASASTPFLHNDRSPWTYAKAMAKALGANPDDPIEDILTHMRSLPARDIVEKSTMFKDWDVTNPLPWKPNVDSYASRSFLPKPWAQLVKQGYANPLVPLIAGVNTEEGLILSAPFHKSPKR